uniref:Putative hhh secreted protein n=1 Tax=Psorophora albipes TaxID=869069 RepID=T1D5M5_9DIPT
MKVLLATFLVTIIALAVIASPHPQHNGTSHHHPSGGQWNGTNAAGSAGRFNRTLPTWFRPPRWGWRNNSRPFSFQPQEVQVQDPVQQFVPVV